MEWVNEWPIIDQTKVEVEVSTNLIIVGFWLNTNLILIWYWSHTQLFSAKCAVACRPIASSSNTTSHGVLGTLRIKRNWNSTWKAIAETVVSLVFGGVVFADRVSERQTNLLWRVKVCEVWCKVSVRVKALTFANWMYMTWLTSWKSSAIRFPTPKLIS